MNKEALFFVKPDQTGLLTILGLCAVDPFSGNALPIHVRVAYIGDPHGIDPRYTILPLGVPKEPRHSPILRTLFDQI